MRLQTKLIGMGRRLLGDRRGNVAMILALCALPLALMVGFSVDLVRQQTTKQDAQSSIDHAALAAAISRAKTREDLQVLVEEYLAANLDNRYLGDDYEVAVDYNEQKQIVVSLQGRIDAFFAALIGRPTMPINVQVTAVRGAADAVELVLVLDNTGSMNVVDGGGLSRIAALKTAAVDLVNAVKENEDADVKVGVVPYAEYVNVGTSNRGQSWLSLNEYDVSNPAKPGNGNYPADMTYKTCAAREPDYWVDVKVELDGRTETKSEKRTGKCIREETHAHPDAGKPRPGSAASTTRHVWHGCVYSRLNDLRLSDADPSTPYVGMVVTNGRRDCMTSILPLTDRKATATSAINAMTTVIAGRSTEPYTYIPAGVVWGVNVLSPAAPFTEGRGYSPANRNPRKIMVLMTDGENTMAYTPGANFADHKFTKAPGQLTKTNADTTAICSYAKSLNIEIYTVALGIEDEASTDMLRGCASNPDFFFNASDNAALGAAFRDIAASINKVRLIR